MENFNPILCFILHLLPLLASCAQKQVYIIYFGEHNEEKAAQEIEETHHSYLLSVKETEEEARASLIYSYKNSINGFSAVLTPHEASKLSELEEVISVIPGRRYSVQTTRSWEFSGLNEAAEPLLPPNPNLGENVLAKAKYGENVIIGMVDNGVWPESKSFGDDGMGPVPKSWKGICQGGDAFNSSHCNKKIIGARYYVKGYEKHFGPLDRKKDHLSPRDVAGHGTHTASTAAGRRVHTATAGGFASGVASGGAPMARLAIYKACWVKPPNVTSGINYCTYADMLAAIDDAIADGVHVLSISIGTSSPAKYSDDAIAIGAFHAVKHNIVVVAAAGNHGPTPSTLSNPAPWIITVGASTVDRQFLTPLLLGNGIKIMGEGITRYKLKKKMHPLVFGGNVVKSNVHQNDSTLGQCLPDTLSPEKVKGKIVMCFRGLGKRAGKGLEVKNAGGVGYILANNQKFGRDLTLDDHLLPQTSVIYDDGLRILRYINSTKHPTAMILPGKTTLHRKPAPNMALFTSQGPNVIDLNILKPDITAPGVNILAAWTGAASPTGLPDDHRVADYYIDSGTSMATPHIAGTAALLKAIHPKWSSAAIRSALITTADSTNNIGKPITDINGIPATPFQFGSGHFHPTKAADPGLIYDASYKDYLLYLCSVVGYTKNIYSTCPTQPTSALNLNYPSFAIPTLNRTVVFKRTVTNVGGRRSVYFFSSKPPKGVMVKASPGILVFDRVNQKKSFTITVKPGNEAKVKKNEYGFGWYTWSDGHHVVKSSMAISLA